MCIDKLIDDRSAMLLWSLASIVLFCLHVHHLCRSVQYQNTWAYLVITLYNQTYLYVHSHEHTVYKHILKISRGIVKSRNLTVQVVVVLSFSWKKLMVLVLSKPSPPGVSPELNDVVYRSAQQLSLTAVGCAVVAAKVKHSARLRYTSSCKRINML